VPTTCHVYKIENMKKDGKEFVEIMQIGDDFEECVKEAENYAEEHNKLFLKSFDSLGLLYGFATIAKEIIDSKKMQG
jgi:threonine dehydratase